MQRDFFQILVFDECSQKFRRILSFVLYHSISLTYEVIDAAGVIHASMIGDQIAESAIKNNWAGIVVNGCVRDVGELKNLPIGIFAKGVIPQKTSKNNHGFEDVLISFGSVVMTSGKWIYIDQNGWLVADNKLEL